MIPAYFVCLPSIYNHPFLILPTTKVPTGLPSINTSYTNRKLEAVVCVLLVLTTLLQPGWEQKMENVTAGTVGKNTDRHRTR